MKALGKLTTKWEVRQAKNGVAPNGMVLALVPFFSIFLEILPLEYFNRRPI